VLTGLSKLIEKLDTSSSENNPTGIALLAHSTIRVPLNTLLKTRTPESTSTRISQDGRNQPSDGKTPTRELHTTDIAQAIPRLCITPELLNNAVNGLETLIQTPDSSSSEDNLTGIAHHAQLHTEVTQLKVPLKTELPESESMPSDHGELPDG
jgi:hypothetical protein